jgi:hypothetical protein
MSVNDEPEPLSCVQCGRPLAEPTAPCPFCEGADASPDPPGAMESFRLLRKARARLLFGFWSAPVLFAPLAAWTAQRGLKLAQSSAAADPGMARRFRRILWLAVALLGITLAVNLALRISSSW